jgi:NADH-quinone oxidoreductase subunit D
MMFDDYSIYSDTGVIYLERLERNLRHFIEDKVSRIRRIGPDILIEMEHEYLDAVLQEIKNNPELSIGVLKSIKKIEDGYRAYILSELRSAGFDYSIILKIGLPGDEEEEIYRVVLEKFKNHYINAASYAPSKGDGEGVCNCVLPADMLNVVEGFDIRLSIEDDIIKKAHLENSVAGVVDKDFFRDLDIDQVVSYMARFDYNAGIFAELALCLGIEELLQLKVPKRARYIRILMSELFRIVSHLYFMANITEILGHDLAWNMIMLEREKLLGIIEEVTGARFIPNYVRIGGVRSNIGSDIIKKIRRVVTGFSVSFKKIERMILADFAFAERLSGKGIIKRDMAVDYGISGPNLRASSIRYDLRANLDYTGYRHFNFTVPYGRDGDCLNRTMVRIGEVHQSIRIIKQALEGIPTGPVLHGINLPHLDFNLTPFISSVECPHGTFKIFGEIEGNRLRTFSAMGPSGQSFVLLEMLLEGSLFDDLEIIIASLDISAGELMDFI